MTAGQKFDVNVPHWPRMFPALLLIGSLSLTPIAALGGILVVVLAFYGEFTKRRNVTLGVVLLSPLFTGQAIFGVRLHVLMLCAIAFAGAVAALGSMSMRQSSWARPNLRSALPAIFIMLVLGINYVVRPPSSLEGEFAVFEQVIIFSLAALFLLFPSGSAEHCEASNSFHWGLCSLALVGGSDSLLALSEQSASAIESRQVSGVFGASNYVAALLAVATVSCAYHAFGRRHRILNSAIAIACLALALPQASRTSTVVVVVVVFVVFIRTVRPGLVLTVCGIVASSAPFFLSSIPAFERFASASNQVDSLNGRWTLWGFAVDEIARYGLIGSGPGNLTVDLQLSGSVPLYVHNVWLSFAVQYGIASLLIFAILLRPLRVSKVSEYVRVISFTVLAISTFEPVVETLKLGVVFVCLFPLLVEYETVDEVNPVVDRSRSLSL